MSKKRKKDEGRKRRDRPTAQAGPPAPVEAPATGGLLTRMRGGIRGFAGVGPKKPESLLSKVLTWALVAVVAYLVARRFGIVP